MARAVRRGRAGAGPRCAGVPSRMLAAPAAPRNYSLRSLRERSLKQSRRVRCTKRAARAGRPRCAPRLRTGAAAARRPAPLPAALRCASSPPFARRHRHGAGGWRGASRNAKGRGHPPRAVLAPAARGACGARAAGRAAKLATRRASCARTIAASQKYEARCARRPAPLRSSAAHRRAPAGGAHEPFAGSVRGVPPAPTPAMAVARRTPGTGAANGESPERLSFGTPWRRRPAPAGASSARSSTAERGAGCGGRRRGCAVSARRRRRLRARMRFFEHLRRLQRRRAGR